MVGVDVDRTSRVGRWQCDRERNGAARLQQSCPKVWLWCSNNPNSRN